MVKTTARAKSGPKAKGAQPEKSRDSSVEAKGSVGKVLKEKEDPFNLFDAPVHVPVNTTTEADGQRTKASGTKPVEVTLRSVSACRPAQSAPTSKSDKKRKHSRSLSLRRSDDKRKAPKSENSRKRDSSRDSTRSDTKKKIAKREDSRPRRSSSSGLRGQTARTRSHSWSVARSRQGDSQGRHASSVLVHNAPYDRWINRDKCDQNLLSRCYHVAHLKKQSTGQEIEGYDDFLWRCLAKPQAVRKKLIEENIKGLKDPVQHLIFKAGEYQKAWVREGQHNERWAQPCSTCAEYGMRNFPFLTWDVCFRCGSFSD